MLRYVFLLVITLHVSNCYALEKNDKQSDASTQKEPSIEEKNLNDSEKARFDTKDTSNGDDNENKPTRRVSQQTISMINQAFDVVQRAFAKPEFRSSKAMTFVDKVLDSMKSYVNGPEFRSSKPMMYIEKVIDIVKDAAKGPEYTSGGQPNMRADMVEFEDGQPALVFHVKPTFLVDVVRKTVSSQLVENILDDISRAQRKAKKHLSSYD